VAEDAIPCSCLNLSVAKGQTYQNKKVAWLDHHTDCCATKHAPYAGVKAPSFIPNACAICMFATLAGKENANGCIQLPRLSQNTGRTGRQRLLCDSQSHVTYSGEGNMTATCDIGFDCVQLCRWPPVQA